MSNSRCIMVIGAHAADAEIMGGATVLKHVERGWRAVILHATLGEGGHPNLPASQYAAIKEKEARAAAEALGAECVMLPYRNGELDRSIAVQMSIANTVRQFRPQVVVTHWHGSLHRDHVNTHHNVVESLYFARHKDFCTDYPPHRPDGVYFAENWEDMEHFRPEVYLNITEVFDRFLTAIHAYSLFRGEVVPFPYEQWYRGASQMRGAEAGCERAVAMMRHRTYYKDRTVAESLLD